MTVAELIAELRQRPQGAVVQVWSRWVEEWMPLEPDDVCVTADYVGGPGPQPVVNLG